MGLEATIGKPRMCVRPARWRPSCDDDDDYQRDLNRFGWLVRVCNYSDTGSSIDSILDTDLALFAGAAFKVGAILACAGARIEAAPAL